MEVLTKKTITIEFEGKKHAISEDMKMEDFLANLGLPKDMTVSLKMTKDGFVLV